MIYSVANLAVFCFWNMLNCFICYAIKWSMIITFSQEFIAFNEPIFLFSFNWCLIFYLTSPLSKISLKRFEDIDFSYVLLPNINFPLSKHNGILKSNPNCWSRQFCHYRKAAIVILRHAYMILGLKQINNQFCCKETSFILCVVSFLIFIIFTEWVSILVFIEF